MCTVLCLRCHFLSMLKPPWVEPQVASLLSPIIWNVNLFFMATPWLCFRDICLKFPAFLTACGVTEGSCVFTLERSSCLNWFWKAMYLHEGVLPLTCCSFQPWPRILDIPLLSHTISSTLLEVTGPCVCDRGTSFWRRPPHAACCC